LNVRRNDREMKMNSRTPWALAAILALSSCATQQVRLSSLGTPCVNAEAQLSQSWKGLNEAVQSGACAQNNGIECQALRAKIERLSVDCPSNPDVVMANALLAFQDRNFTRAQQLLDDLFSKGVNYPEAVALRARVALSEGNSRFALRFLEEKIRENGSDSGIRETYASALFVANRWDEAQTQLNIAARLGAPLWRVAFGSGLIEEAKGNYEVAKLKYQEALKGKPGWPQAESRLRALVATGKTSQ